MPKRTKGRRVVGLGGIFFRARDPGKMARWYQDRLGIKITDNVALFTWAAPRNPRLKGYTVWSLFPQNTRYFGANKNQFMVNYRVKNLASLLSRLRKEGVRVDRKVEESPYGLFAWITDPEGNRVELWQPPRAYKAPEDQMPME